jgi:hypothetical protein
MSAISSERFIFFTKTEWNEPPRLRHQLARLLAAPERQVFFGQRPRLWGTEPVGAPIEPHISLFRHRELIHHRIRISPPVRTLNAAWTIPSIREALRSLAVTDDDVIVNFNYEYLFLRQVFPSQVIITLINDDFVSRALPRCRASLEFAQRRTCERSDAVMTPSVVIQRQLEAFSRPELFLPWLDAVDSLPTQRGERRILLYWGFVDWRVDLNFLEQLAKCLEQKKMDNQIWVVGPRMKATGAHPLFHRYKCVRTFDSAKLSQLPTNEILGGLIPFKSGLEGCDAIVLPNKALQLLGYGLPLLITGMPHFPDEPFVYRLDRGDPIEVVQRAGREFENVQAAIRSFVAGHTPQARLSQFLKSVERARSARLAQSVR